MSHNDELNPSGGYMVYCTCPDAAVADQLAQRAVSAGLAACVNLLPGVTSVYRWQGRICHDREVLLLIKTAETAYPALERLILQHHPYQVPEIIALPIARGYAGYLQWLHEQSAADGTEK